jgi:signal recognition particle receptor subunit beta
VIFVIESNNRERLDDARNELLRVTQENDLREAPILILANKQDLADALTPPEIAKLLELEKIPQRKWLLLGSSASQGKGLAEGMEWLSNNITGN